MAVPFTYGPIRSNLFAILQRLLENCAWLGLRTLGINKSNNCWRISHGKRHDGKPIED
jgi:hypothetical protein